MSSFCFAYLVVLRYRDLQFVLGRKGGLNRVMLLLGLAFCVGMALVAAFQSALVPIVHYIGALVLFVCSTAYMGANAVMSRRMASRRHLNRHVLRLRWACAFLQTLSFVVLVAFAIVWKIRTVNGSLYWWRYVAVCEYVMAFSLALSIISLVADLRLVVVSFLVESVIEKSTNSTKDERTRLV